MKIEKININEIKEYKNNTKKHPDNQIKKIALSIEKYGFNDPIAIDENNIIIEGHGRYLALKQLNYTDVEVIRLPNLSEQQKNEYRIVHNQLTMNTPFNLKKLEEALVELDLDIFGVKPITIDWDKLPDTDIQPKEHEQLKEYICQNCGKTFTP